MTKKMITLLIAGSMVLGSTVALAEELVTPINTDTTVEQTTEAISAFVNKTMTIKEIQDDMYICEDQDKNPCELSLGSLQFAFDANGEKYEIAVGDTITAYMSATAPMVLSYPSRYTPSVIIKDVKDQKLSVNVDHFTATENKDEYVNAENSLVVTISEDTQILKLSREAFDGNLDGQDLVVFYDAATFSIPAMTNPKKVIVLNKVEEETAEAPEIDLTAIKNISCGDKTIALTTAEADNVTMVPLRSIAEALGFTVEWNDTIKSITLNGGYSLQIGENSYVKGKMIPITLEAAPQCIEMNGTGITHVPFSYFTEVLEAAATVDGDTLSLSIE